MSCPQSPPNRPESPRTVPDASAIDPAVLRAVAKVSHALTGVLEAPELLSDFTRVTLAQYLAQLLIDIVAEEDQDPLGIFERVHEVLRGMGFVVAENHRQIHERPGPGELH